MNTFSQPFDHFSNGLFSSPVRAARETIDLMSLDDRNSCEDSGAWPVLWGQLLTRQNRKSTGLACRRSWVRTHGRVKPMTYKMDTCHFLARCSALLE